MPAIREIGVTSSQISFTGNWIGPSAGQTMHVLRRSDLPPGTNTAPEIETYLNDTWLPAQLRDVTGARVGYAMVHVLSVNGPNDVTWEVVVSDNPIAKWW